MSKAKHRGRRQRRRLKAVMKHGKKAVRAHKRKSGRTGSIWAKRTHGSANATPPP